MTSTKRRINSTGRKRINRENIDARMLDSEPNQPLRATVKLDLSAYNFPPAALISIEAYHRSSGMRFECGTVSSPSIPSVFTLNEIDNTGSVLFRVKVVDTSKEYGRILGSAERIQPLNEGEDKDQQSLFPVLYRSLGEQVWKVEINPGDRPKLILNREIPSIQHRLKTDSFLQGLLFPAAFRIVMEALVAGSSDDEDDDSEQMAWQSEWTAFCTYRLGMTPTTDPEKSSAWVDDAVNRFCEEHGFMKAIRKLEDEIA
jgi:hypothetical protein